MRRAGLVVARTLDAVAAQARPGVTTAELDAVAAATYRGGRCRPSFLGYGADEDRPGFPGVVCLSVNDEVVHGDPRRAGARRRATCSRSTAARSSTAGTATPRSASSWATAAPGRGRRAARDDAVGAVARHRRAPDRWPGHRRRRRRRGRVGRRRRTGSSRTTSATASARPCTWRPTSRTADRAGRWPACGRGARASCPGRCWPSSRCSRWATRRPTSSTTAGPRSPTTAAGPATGSTRWRSRRRACGC